MLRNLTSETVIGFLGGGQLARMSAYKALEFGLKTAVYCNGADTEPMEMVTPLVWKGSFSDAEKLRDFFSRCSVVTLENEFLDASLLDQISRETGVPLYPQPSAFRQLEDKITEKRTFEKCGVPIGAWQPVKSVSDCEAFISEHGIPAVLKVSKGGYDGYGNRTIRSASDLNAAFEQLGGNSGAELLMEAFVPFTAELAVSVVRNQTGMISFPCVETVQKNHICKEVYAPARIAPEFQQQAREMAMKVVEFIGGIGIFAFEFFFTEDGRVLMNESAPRPHNSAHFSIEGCVTSQFENHVRAVLGWPLGSTELRKPAAVMINLLGQENAPFSNPLAEPLLAEPDGHLHYYGKLKSKKGRKMGHFTLLGDDLEKTIAKARALTADL